jgi:hypothetical protein
MGNQPLKIHARLKLKNPHFEKEGVLQQSEAPSGLLFLEANDVPAHIVCEIRRLGLASPRAACSM